MSSYDQGKTDSLYSPKSVIIVVLVVGGKFLAIDMLRGSSVVPMFISVKNRGEILCSGRETMCVCVCVRERESRDTRGRHREYAR